MQLLQINATSKPIHSHDIHAESSSEQKTGVPSLCETILNEAWYDVSSANHELSEISRNHIERTEASVAEFRRHLNHAVGFCQTLASLPELSLAELEMVERLGEAVDSTLKRFRFDFEHSVVDTSNSLINPTCRIISLLSQSSVHQEETLHNPETEVIEVPLVERLQACLADENPNSRVPELQQVMDRLETALKSPQLSAPGDLVLASDLLDRVAEALEVSQRIIRLEDKWAKKWDLDGRGVRDELITKSDRSAELRDEILGMLET